MMTFRSLRRVRLARLNVVMALLLMGMFLPQGTMAQESSISEWTANQITSVDCDTGVITGTIGVNGLVGPLIFSWFGNEWDAPVQSGSYTIAEEEWPYEAHVPFEFTMDDISQVYSVTIRAKITAGWAETGTFIEIPCGAVKPVDLGYTPFGENVTVAPLDGVTITFSNVRYDGITTVTPTSTAPALPSGYLQVGGTFYDVTTNATISGPVTVCFAYDPGAADGASIRLMHYENGAWVDVTTTNDGVGTVCGVVSTFSPFALVFRAAGPTGPTTKADCMNGGWQAYGYANQGLCIRDVNKPRK